VIKIKKTGPAQLNDYLKISAAFEVRDKLILKQTERGVEFVSEKISVPYTKDYDLYENPSVWYKKWDLEKWGLFIAETETGLTAGAAAVAYDTPELTLTEKRKDITVLWDIRVNPEYRRKGTGKLLFEKALEFTKLKNCSLMKIETQDNNTGACKFYSAMGCILSEINPGVYSEFPGEIQLIWHKRV